jgi:hypothetical protein
VQLAPASTAHHHAGPGGLATHTLDVIERALRQRKSFELPLNAGPEIIFEQEHYWTYAVFIGSILHDIGKMTTNTLIVLNNGKVWNPHKSSLLDSEAKSYHIRFDKHPYKYHTQIANSFFHMIPEKGRGWLSDNPPIFTELCAWLYGDYYEFGMIGKIIRYADGQSVAANLKIGGERVRFNNAPEIPLIEKMMTALREMLESGELKINGAEGSSGWTDGTFTYLVCGTVADKVRSYLHKMGSSDIPGDNTRLFDTWQEHGYAISNSSDAAIWLIKIDNRLKLTVLKFETNRLFHPSKQPGEFQGQISVIDNNRDLEPTPEQGKPLKTGSEPEIKVSESTIEHGQTPKPVPETVSVDTEKSADDPFADTPLPETDATRTAANPGVNQEENDHVKDFYMAENDKNKELEQNEVIDQQDSKQVYQKPSKLPENLKLADPDIARHFITWIQEGLQERKIQVNNSKALVHVVKEGALIVTPIAFKKFLWDNKLHKEGENITKQVTRIQDRLKAIMEKKKKHRRTKLGINIHTYQINGDTKTSKIKCWLLPTKTVFVGTPPPLINSVLENSSGFEDEEKV